VNCDHVRELAPELALNTASGEERAEALQHISSCSECRTHLESTSELADGLLLLAPSIEPPAGFETRVLGERRSSLRRWARPLAAAAAVISIAGAASGLTWMAGGHDRNLAADATRQQHEFNRVNGTYFAAAQVRGDNGKKVGQAFGYDGAPSWVYVAGGHAMTGHTFRVWAVTDGGHRIDLGSMQITSADRGWGALIPVGLDRVRSLRMVGPTGYVCTAQLHTD
jgi:hypothetical protein